MRRWLVIAAALLLVDVQASEIPVDAFFAPPLIESVGVAPDGSRLAALTRMDGKAEVRIYILGDEEIRPDSRLPVPHPIAGLTWLTSRHLGLWTSPTTHTYPWASYSRGSRRTVHTLYAMQVPSGPPLKILTQVNRISAIVARDPASEHHLLMHSYRRTAQPVMGIMRRRYHTDLSRVDLRDASSELMAKGRLATSTYLLDPDGGVLRLDVTDDEIEILRLVAGTDDWARLHQLHGADRHMGYFTAIQTLFGRTTFLSRERGENLEYDGLFEYNLLQLDYRKPVVALEGIDIVDTLRAPLTGEAIGYSYLTHRRQHVYFEELLQSAQAAIDDFFPNSENLFIDRSETNRFFVFKVTEASDPGRYVVFDRSLEKITQLGALNPRLSTNATKVERFEFTSAGRTLTGILTVSLHAQDKALPLIVYPTREPGQAQWIRYEPDVQYFASRGFAVFQANTRGTSGYGHSLSALAQPGVADVEDLDAGVRALARSGRVDGKRVCAVGRGYAGRTALQLAASSDAIACVAVEDPALTIKSWLHPYRSRRSNAAIDQTIAEDFGSEAHLAATRPKSLASEFKAPILYLKRVNNLRHPHREFDLAMRRAAAPMVTRKAPTDPADAAEAMLAFIENRIGRGSVAAQLPKASQP